MKCTRLSKLCINVDSLENSVLVTITAASCVSEKGFKLDSLNFLIETKETLGVICELKGKNLPVSGQEVTPVKTYLLVVSDRGYRASQDHF